MLICPPLRRLADLAKERPHIGCRALQLAVGLPVHGKDVVGALGMGFVSEDDE